MKREDAEEIMGIVSCLIAAEKYDTAKIERLKETLWLKLESLIEDESTTKGDL